MQGRDPLPPSRLLGRTTNTVRAQATGSFRYRLICPIWEERPSARQRCKLVRQDRRSAAALLGLNRLFIAGVGTNPHTATR